MARGQLVGMLAGLVVLFVFFPEPIWRRVWDPDASILWSYTPIPFLVAGCQLWNRTWTMGRWLVATFVVVAFKYMITAAIFLTLLLIAGKPPERGAATRPDTTAAQAAVEDPEPEPTVIDPKDTGTIHGIVRDPESRPFAGALVHVRSGLEGYFFPKPKDPVRIAIRDWAHVPPILGIRVGQPLVTESVDRQVHTLNAFGDGKQFLFNVPVLGEREIRFSHPRTHVEMRCAVHGDERGYVGVFAHPFFQVTGSDGRFEFRGVPRTAVVVAAWNPNYPEIRVSTRAEAGAAAPLDLRY